MKKLLLILTFLLFTTPVPVLALHQAGPPINCVAVVYDSIDLVTGTFRFENVPWADVRTLGDFKVIIVKVFHDRGFPGGPGTQTFGGSAGYAIFGGTSSLKVVAVGSNGVNTTALYRQFHANGNQSFDIPVPTEMAESSTAGAVVQLTPQDFSQADNDTAKAMDVGLCTPLE